jgi:hypothetical protein
MAMKHGLAILILEQKAKSYDHDVFRGREIHGDPEEQMQRYEEMAQQCREAAEVLKALG